MASQSSRAEDSSPRSSTVISTPLFRPIEFESQPGSSEGSESGGSDSAYGSEQPTTPMELYQVKAVSYFRKVTASVQNKQLWKMFTRIGNEMIVTKPGRRLFPSLLVNMQGLEDTDYTVALRISSTDNQRYRYINMKWVPTGESEVIQNDAKQIFRHPSSPNSGRFWMKRPISFKTIKITHFAKSKHGNILLHTMHKYSMEIILHRSDGTPPLILPLPDTSFIAVSAYQNMELTQLKIDNNPFAKGFRYKGKTPTVQSPVIDGAMGVSEREDAVKSEAVTPVKSVTQKVTPRIATVMPDRSMMTYIQHLQQIHNLATPPTYVPAMLTGPTASGPAIVATSGAGAKLPVGVPHPPMPVLASPGMGPSYPVFYPAPPYLPQYLMPPGQPELKEETK